MIFSVFVVSLGKASESNVVAQALKFKQTTTSRVENSLYIEGTQTGN
ncbi:Uncharacterised protein [Acinetobacter baumannii]|nr:Uncharacterised protein [Acinetobacter baumannii]SSU32360.1 Uncharacterised protein [Acinetobacter baumannii]